MAIRWTLFLLALVTAARSYGCSCARPPAEQKKARAEIVFRGTITEIREPEKPKPGEWRKPKILVFRVSRVWKGKVGEVFEMPGVEGVIDCTGFWPQLAKVGTDVLVYASRNGNSADFHTNICGGNLLASAPRSVADHAWESAAKDLAALGPGSAPASPP